MVGTLRWLIKASRALDVRTNAGPLPDIHYKLHPPGPDHELRWWPAEIIVHPFALLIFHVLFSESWPPRISLRAISRGKGA
jgi:hypothetical protein